MTKKFKILGRYIKDLSSETPDVETYIFVKDRIGKYQLDIDIKSKAVKNILPLVPYFQEYREPFVGGGSIFLALKHKFPEKKFWINDIYIDLFSFWSKLKDDTEKLIDEVQKIFDEKIFFDYLSYEIKKQLLNLTDLFHYQKLNNL